LVLVSSVLPQGLVGLAHRAAAVGHRLVAQRVHRPGGSEPPTEASPVDVPEVAPIPAGGPLVVRNASRAFGGVRALSGVDITVDEGTVHALVGPNGSGKTTLLNLISGYYPLDSGSVEVGGTVYVRHRPEQIARAGIARTFQTPRLIHSDDVLGNVMLGCD